MIFYHIAYIAVVGLAACALVFGLPRVGRIRRIMTVAALGLIIPVAYLSIVDLQGRPRPIQFDFLTDSDMEIIAYSFIEGEAIFLWTAKSGEPLSFRLPWSAERARRLHGLMEDTKKGGGKVMMRRRGDNTLRSQQMFYRSPVKPLPPKEDE